LIDRERLRKLFPHLAREMEEGGSKVHIDQYRREDAERPTGRRWVGYDPDVVDFIRRCETVEQAEEIIGYLEGRGEITAEAAAELRRRLREEGLKGLGDRKEPDFYHRQG